MKRPVVTLTTIPPRFGKIGATLDSLLTQRLRPAQIQLYVPRRYRRFPDWDGRLPKLPKGIQLRRCERDYGPATKILPAARAYRDDEIPLIFCDDDRAYPSDWIERLVDAGRARPDAAVALLGFEVEAVTGRPPSVRPDPRAQRRWRVTDLEFQARYGLRRLREGRAAPEPGRRVFRKSGMVDIFEGCAGVLVRSDFFDEAAFAIPNVAWTVDDVWLSGMLARRGIPIWLTANAREPELTEAEAQAPLVTAEIDGMRRAEANRAAVEYLQKHFHVWR